ncbi:arsenic-transporting ATPase [Halorhodospira abdelmalekii]|uniref:ArsA family ATPase n=1 Tax=Halorhodospira abdelmalekii TaxID=421629 RepID=UPI001908686D|nr:ArsA family ATPase [Halorhodospira abdelmalekii]MBK1734132.1 arsenic-transporting ATPase [Halorhodospira abdelmalekii]
MDQSINRPIEPAGAHPGAGLPTAPILFFSGKGGVGKTTLAAAYALGAAQAGRRVLLVSTDPAHNLGDVFAHSLGATPQTVRPGLDAVEIDPDAECARYIGRVKENIRACVRSSLIGEAERHIDMAARAPGAYEAALFDRIVAIVLDEARPGQPGGYDQVIFDTAPTGHTVRLLSLPELMGAWVDGLLRYRSAHNRERSQWLGGGEVPEDPLYDLLSERRWRIAQMRDALLDGRRCAFVLVLTAEHLPIQETARALPDLEAYGLTVWGLAVNKLLPAEAAESAFLAQRCAAEARHLATIDRLFADRTRLRVPLLGSDVDSLAGLEAIAATLWRSAAESATTAAC